MKNSLMLSVFIIFTTAANASELAWVNEQIEAIKHPRKAILISNVHNPFIFLEKNNWQKNKEPIIEMSNKPIEKLNKQSNSFDEKLYMLNAIINDSAMINAKWYKKGDKINGYVVTNISKNSVIIKSNSRRIVLKTLSENKSLKFKNR